MYQLEQGLEIVEFGMVDMDGGALLLWSKGEDRGR